MNYLRPELLDRLASEYVLGTLRGHARRRFEKLLIVSGAARRAAAAWQERLAPLAQSAPEVVPPPRLWSAIRSRIAALRRRR